MDKTALDQLVRRVESLEHAIEQMFTAFKGDLASLRAELVRFRDLEQSGRPALSRPPTRPGLGARFTPPPASAVPPSSARPGPRKPSAQVAEETVRPRKRDPRADDE